MNEIEKFDLFFFEEHFQDGECRFETGGNRIAMYEWDDHYSIQTEPAKPDMICTMKCYFADTLTLSEEGHYLKLGGTPIGIWKKYDQFGNLVEAIDYEQPWGISWEGLQPCLVSMRISLDEIQDIARFDKSIADAAKEEIEEEEEMEEETEEEEKEKEEEEIEEGELEEEEEEIEEGEMNDDDGLVPMPVKAGQKNANQQDEDEKLDHCWVITTNGGFRKSIVYYFDGDTGKFITLKVKTYQ